MAAGGSGIGGIAAADRIEVTDAPHGLALSGILLVNILTSVSLRVPTAG